MKTRTMRLATLLTIPMMLALNVTAVVVSASSKDTPNGSSAEEEVEVTVIGLGSMGSAVSRCLASQDGYKVHGWNRGTAQREAHADVLQIHDTAEEAIAASNLVIFMIDNWDGVDSLVRAHQEALRNDKDRITVLFSTYSPTQIQELDSAINGNNEATNINLVGGAIVGVPQTICTPHSLILASSTVTALEPLGRTVFVGSGSDGSSKEVDNDVGAAALMNMALVLTIFFGLAGHELAHLMISLYGVSTDFEEIYKTLATEVAAEYFKMLLPATSHAMNTQDYSKMYAPTEAVLGLLQHAVTLKQKLGVTEPTFLDAYVKSLEQVADPSRNGPAAWTKAVLDKIPPKEEPEL